ncbi:MAG: RecQ family ATP-dependent DNA helicase, partial [Oscillospiraceae bacterium]|nr:RecQ family ATP-dependent DNA helicase [Oscillospiraceae bacterium]
MDKYSVLQQHFGYTSFRQGQETLIDAIVSGRDALGIMPTGGGKSLCYQIPALLRPGITLVVSPLISLMKDQVSALKPTGISAAYINSSLSAEQIRLVYRRAEQGAYKLLYVAPERLETEEFLALSRALSVSLVAVDEAHCISQWGQDFRPSYLKIPDFIRSLPRRPVVAAFTATATTQVRQDIVRLLELADPVCAVTGFDRPNLFFDVRSPKNKFQALFDLIAARADKTGIVYCSTRANVERVCQALCSRGVAATRY